MIKVYRDIRGERRFVCGVGQIGIGGLREINVELEVLEQKQAASARIKHYHSPLRIYGLDITNQAEYGSKRS